jgi:hypothetical protein
VVGVNLTQRSRTGTPATPVYYPGTSSARDALIVRLDAGDHRNLGTLRLREQ